MTRWWVLLVAVVLLWIVAERACAAGPHFFRCPPPDSGRIGEIVLVPNPGVVSTGNFLSLRCGNVDDSGAVYGPPLEILYVPEPAGILPLLMGAGLVVGLAWRKRR